MPDAPPDAPGCSLETARKEVERKLAQQKLSQLQYTEYWRGRSGLTFGVEAVLCSRQTDFQRIEVLETDAFGRLLLLDGLVMLTERDEFVYHEMIAHPALCLLEDPRHVLIVGGGDGGTAREVLRHASVEHVDLVEIDAAVVEVARAYFPHVAGALEDERLHVHAADGAAFVADAAEGAYDLVLIDSTDPVGMAESLFGAAFYRHCARALAEPGVLVAQTESPFDPVFRAMLGEARALLGKLFPHVHMYLASIPTYPMGTWSFTMATRGLHPTRDFDAARAAERMAPFAGDLRYYTPRLHRAAFVLPAFVERMMEE